MSYRDDLEAALARVNSLEHELTETKKSVVHPPKPVAVAVKQDIRPLLIVGALAIAVMAAIALANTQHAPRVVDDEALGSADTPPPRASHVVDCAKALAPNAASTRACVEEIQLAVADAGLGPDVHDVLVRWHGYERAGKLAERDDMLSEIRTVIVPEFTH